MSVIRTACFTWNNYPEDHDKRLEGIFEYVIWGYETAPTTGTPHLQGYAELRKPMKFTSLKKLVDEAISWHPRRGTQEQAIEYCKKGGRFVELGQKKQQGRRTDLDIVRQNALELGMREITSQYNFQQIKVAEKFLTYNEEPRDWKPTVVWIWGPTGSGKSKLARELTTNDDVYTKNDGTKWWEGYDAHENVIIDDFRDSWWSLTEMLSLLDRYEKRIEFKGGLRQFKPRKILITSIFAPQDCYRGTGECLVQLTRRIDDTIELVAEVAEVAGVILNPAT